MERTINVALLALAVASLSACKKDSEDPAPTTPPATELDVDATVRMAWTFKIGEHAYTLDSVLYDDAGHAVKLDAVRFFVSGAHGLNDEEEEVAHFEETYLLVDASQTNDYLMGPVHCSHIHEFHFDLGVDSAANHVADIGTANAPLNDATMHWNMDDGYKFLVVTGHANLDADPDYETAISYTCGMDAVLTDAHAHLHHSFTEGETFTAEALVDMALMFTSINVQTTPTGTMDEAVCTQLMTNLASAIDGVE